MISGNFHYCLLLKPASTDNNLLDFLQVVYHSTNFSGCTYIDDLSKRITAFALPVLQAIPPLKQEITFAASLSKEPLFKKKRYKPRKWMGHSYERNVERCLMETIQRYDTVFNGDVYPTRKTLAQEINVSMTTIDKAKKRLRAWGLLKWVSGKYERTSNRYIIHESYRKTPIPCSGDVTLSHHVWYPLKRLAIKERNERKGFFVFEQLLKDIGQYLLRRRENITNFFRMNSRNNLKTSTDPPKKRKKPPNWHLFSKYNLYYKDQWILARYSEAVLRQAIDDLEFYQNEGHTVKKVAAFLMNRCKDHQEKSQLLKKETRRDLKEWITGYFKSCGKRFNFISHESTIDRQTSDSRPFIELKFHQSDIKKSRLHVYQRVCGQWIDKLFTFDRPDFVEAVELYLERSLREVF